MMIGVVQGGRKAIVRLAVLALDGRSDEVEAVIDTGFTGYLTLPADEVSRLGLPQVGADQARLADGRLVAVPFHLATVLWDGVPRSIFVSAIGTTLLLGMKLLRGLRLTIDVLGGGPVTIGPIP